MAWIELHQALWTHRKTLIMSAALNLPPVYTAAHVAHLWCWALDNAPDGDISRLPDDVIAVGAGWTGDPHAFVEAAVTAGFFDRNGDSLHLHDWEDYAGRLIDRRAAERERSRQRRAAAKQPEDDPPTTAGRPPDDPPTTVGTVPNRTVPSTDPCTSGTKPVPHAGGQAADEAPSDEAPKAGNRLEAIEQVMECYNQTFSGLWARPLRLTPDRKAKIRARLKTYTVEEICQAIRNIRASPFHCGENDAGKIYATPEFICRNDGMVDKWLNVKPKDEDQQTTPVATDLAELERLHQELEELTADGG